MKSPEYYSHTRDDIIDIVISTGSIEKILDVGCGYGYTGESLKERGATTVEGLEIDKDASKEAERRLDKIYHGSAEDSHLIGTLSIYDCIICADLLEHLTDPWDTLTLLRDHLHKNGRLVCSIPNIRYFKILFKLMFFGDWNYEDSGILDKTHLRFFTRKTIEMMFKQAGYKTIIIKQKTRRVTTLFNFFTLGLFGDLFPMKFYIIAHLTGDNRNI